LLLVASSLFVIYQSLFIILPVVSYSHLIILLGYFKFISVSVRSVHSVWSVHPFIQYSITQCHFCPDTRNVFQVFQPL
jgi:uncharacterized membrane protein YkgB